MWVRVFFQCNHNISALRKLYMWRCRNKHQYEIFYILTYIFTATVLKYRDHDSLHSTVAMEICYFWIFIERFMFRFSWSDFENKKEIVTLRFQREYSLFSQPVFEIEKNVRNSVLLKSDTILLTWNTIWNFYNWQNGHDDEVSFEKCKL